MRYLLEDEFKIIMRTLSISLLFSLILSYGLKAQTTYKSVRLSTPPKGAFIPNEIQKDYGPILHKNEAPKPGSTLSKKELRELKTQVQSLKSKRAVRTSTLGQAEAPLYLDSLSGNAFSGSVPNDNGFAINNDGQLISVINSNIYAYDIEGDSLIFAISLGNFSLPIREARQSKYDPRVLFDPEANRFIIVYLNGTVHRVSKIIVAFSKSSNPAEGFNLYALEGNPLDNDTWSDYPHIMVSNEDLFITMNTFLDGSSNNSGYVESTIRQVSKNAGYDSLALIEQYYYDIKVAGKNLFNSTGVKGGSAPYSPPIYFASNRALSLTNDSLFLISISDSLSPTTTPSLEIKTVITDNPYGLPSDARQKNGHRFDCNDARVQGAFYENNRFQIVGNTVGSLGNSSTYHIFYNIKKDGDTAMLNLIELDTLDLGFANISYTGKSSGENEAIITFNTSGPKNNAGFGTVFFDNDSSYSEITVLKEGNSLVNVITGGGDPLYERWGDYSGSQKVYDEDGVIWASGYSSISSSQPETWIVQLASPNANDDPLPEEKDVLPFPLEVGPNPSNGFVNVHFYLNKPESISFYLVNMQGQLAKEIKLLEEDAAEGENEFSFNTQSMRTGTYFLLVRDSGGNVLHEEKLIIL